MEHIIKRDLHQVILALENDRAKQGICIGYRFNARNISRRELVDRAMTVFNALKDAPYITGSEVCRKYGIDRPLLAVIYKIIQRSSVCQDYFGKSCHRDYFTILKHYFNHHLYNVVFFVGTDCPSRCVYCPSVTVDGQGKRHIKRYAEDKTSKLTEKHFVNMFDDLARFKSRGMMMIIKISGGLEPLTDIESVQWIVRLAGGLELPVKLFTNGLLLNTPERRRTALETADIRISLSTTDERQYQRICFSDRNTAPENMILPRLKENIRLLVKERPSVNTGCKIGFNCVIRPENHTCIEPLIEMAKDIGIDYIDFKPDYFSVYDEDAVFSITESIQKARTKISSDAYSCIFINFAGTLSMEHLYWKAWNNTCNPVRQADFKIFITPFGQCSPVHNGAFPHYDASVGRNNVSYYIGRIGEGSGLIDILSNPAVIPEIGLKELNPFELMLSLEISREEEDTAWGLPLCVSPYHTSQRDQIPADLFFRFGIDE
jgi:molybdenum cofactor biosynthesis enzyme MoaA